MEYQTPLIKQYFSIVNQYPGTIVLMRVGDFYETYGEIAIETSKVLGISLTRRSIGSSLESSNLELSGFPYHSLDSYLSKLVQFGYKIVICDQLEDPAKAKGLVKRGVTEIITPGLITQDAVLNNRNNNYLCSLFFLKDNAGIAFLDISTGEFKTTEGNINSIQKLLDSFNPSEIIYSKQQEEYIYNLIDEKKLILDKKKLNSGLQDWIFKKTYAVELLTSLFGSVNLKGFGLEEMSLSVISSGAILQYLKDTGHENINHITTLARIEQDKYMFLDKYTIKNLELIKSQYENGKSLIDVLDNTVTSMGGRMLKKWITLPLKNKEEILARQNYVTSFFENEEISKKITSILSNVTDLERIICKISMKKAIPKDLTVLSNSLKNIKEIKSILSNSIKTNGIVLYNCQELTDEIDKTILENSESNNFIKEGIDKTLDEYKRIKFSSNESLKILLQNEISRTGITSLKIGYNKIYGYYFDVTNAHKDKIPGDWIRKQTLTTGERFINEELKLFEEKIINADGKINEIENEIFDKLIQNTEKYIKYILHDAEIIAKLDCYINFALLAKKNKYICPKISDSDKIDIKKGRHPVIETTIKYPDFYVANDIFLDKDKQQIMLITGPNMVGKSALLREVALIILMAQIGSYVPADYAEIGIIDKIFTRVGASDNVSSGESTFMLEMNETANILHNISEKSLILMDEIGRGTSTYDGISIAWAILEYLHNSSLRPKTLFATHYHELCDLEGELERLFNFRLTILEENGKIIFVRRLEKKRSEHSFGINVAKLSGIPNPVIEKAEEILRNLENNSTTCKNNIVQERNKNVIQNNEIEKFIFDLDINSITPMEALMKLHEIKKKLNTKKQTKM